MTSKGRVTIPLPIGEQAGLVPGPETGFEFGDAGGVRWHPKADRPRSAALEEVSAPPRGSATAEMGTEETMALARGET